MNDFSSVNVDGMEKLISALNGAGRELGPNLAKLQARMREAGVTLQTLDAIERIGEWANEQVPGLQRRQNMADALLGEEPGIPVARFDEPIPFDTPEEAEEYGRRLANDLITDPEFGADTFDRLMEQFQPYVHDPDVMAGFYLELDPNITMRLAEYLHHTGAEDGAAYLRSFSTGLGTALSTDNHTSPTSDYYTELTDLRHAFSAPSETPAQAWNKLALLQHGDFPPRWLSDVVRNNVLSQFEHDLAYTQDYRGRYQPTLGMSGDTLALALSALGNNPSAARIALTEKSSVTLSTYVNSIYHLHGNISTADQIADSLGQALAAGSGALDQPPDNGHHASAFAYEAILALGRPGHPSDSYDIVPAHTPTVMREHIGTIAAAYADELLTGSWTAAGWNGLESSMDEPPDGLVLPPGLDPAFYLSPTDVARFLNNVGPPGAQWAEFDEAVGELFKTLPTEALQADVAAREAGEAYTSHFETINNMFGSLDGLQHQAHRKALGVLDEREQAPRNVLGELFLVAAITVPTGWGQLVAAGRVGTVVEWLGYYFGFKAIRGWVDGAGGRAEELDESAMSERFLVDYMIAHRMIEAGYPHQEPLPHTLLDSNGNIRSPIDIAGDPALSETFGDWIASNSTSGAGDNIRGDADWFGDKLRRAAYALRAGEDSYAEEIAHEINN